MLKLKFAVCEEWEAILRHSLNGYPIVRLNSFSTDYASGSTSQAANIMEAINFGCKLLLIDEDRSATNFMIQDIKMRSLIKHEPVTPFTERVRELYEAAHVSSVLVIGGSGEFLSVADQIILMDNKKRNRGSQKFM